jgi:hypothetical protein
VTHIANYPYGLAVFGAISRPNPIGRGCSRKLLVETSEPMRHGELDLVIAGVVVTARMLYMPWKMISALDHNYQAPAVQSDRNDRLSIQSAGEVSKSDIC